MKSLLSRAGWAMALCATLSFSIAPTVGRAAIVNGVNPTQLLLARFGLAMLLFGAMLVITLPYTQCKLSRRSVLACVFVGVANGFGMLAFFWGLNRVEASTASMLMALVPVVVLTVLAVCGERVSWRSAIRLALGVTGTFFLFSPKDEGDSGGLFLILLTVILFSLQLLCAQWYLGDDEPQVVAAAISGTMFVVIGGVWLWQGAVWQPPSTSGWMAIGILAVVSTWLGRITLYGGVRLLGSGQTALLMPLESLLSVLWAVLYLGEQLAMSQRIGGILIVVSAMLAAHRLGNARPWRRPQFWTRG